MLLFLRGEIPGFRPDRLEYDPKNIDTCEDMWTVLAERLSRHLGRTEVWYWGGPRYKKIKVTSEFYERHIPDFKYKLCEVPKFKYIIARGGFKQYDPVLRAATRGAKLVYYGAGARFYPQPGMHRKYDFIFVDTEKQRDEVLGILPTGKIRGAPIIIPKPAAPMFRPVEVKKDFDICFPGAGQPFKGYKDMFKALSGTDLRVMCVGIAGNNLLKEYVQRYGVRVKFVGWHRRRKLSEFYSRCKIGLVMTHGKRDSCPRVIPEMIACDIPVLVADWVNVSTLHINPQTGDRAPSGLMPTIASTMIRKRDRFSPRKYYDKFLTVDRVADKIAAIVKEM